MKTWRQALPSLALFAAAAAAPLASPMTAQAAEISRKSFGQTPDGQAVEAITLTNGKGVSATVIT